LRIANTTEESPKFCRLETPNTPDEVASSSVAPIVLLSEALAEGETHSIHLRPITQRIQESLQSVPGTRSFELLYNCFGKHSSEV